MLKMWYKDVKRCRQGFLMTGLGYRYMYLNKYGTFSELLPIVLEAILTQSEKSCMPFVLQKTINS